MRKNITSNLEKNLYPNLYNLESRNWSQDDNEHESTRKTKIKELMKVELRKMSGDMS